MFDYNASSYEFTDEYHEHDEELITFEDDYPSSSYAFPYSVRYDEELFWEYADTRSRYQPQKAMMSVVFITVILFVIGVGMITRGFNLHTLNNKFSSIFTASFGSGSAVQSVVMNSFQNSSNGTAQGTDCDVSSRFPERVLQWCLLISSYARQHNLPPDLLAALILQESGGDSQAFSHSGAVGLMQVMPSDGPAANFMCANGPCFSNRPTTDQLMDPEFNVKYGTKMLAQLISRNGNLREALKSYGPMDVGFYYADKVLALFQQYGNNP